MQNVINVAMSIWNFLNQPAVVALLASLLVFEQWLASTDKFKSNSTVQFIGNGLKWLVSFLQKKNPQV